MATGPAWLFVALKVDGHDSDYLQKKLFPATTVGSQPALGRATRRATKAIGDLLTGTAGGVYGGNLFCTVLDDSGTRAAGAISCTQSNASGDYVRFTYGAQQVTLTEGVDFSRGTNDEDLAENLGEAINEHPILGSILIAEPNKAAVDALIDLTNDLTVNYLAHIASNTYHNDEDTDNTVPSDPVTTVEEAIARLNAIKAAYTAHIADTNLHDQADATNTVSASDATSITTANTLASELKTDFNAHRVQPGVHDANDSDNVVTESTAAVGVIVLTSKLPTQLAQDLAMSTGDATAFSLTQLTGGTEGAAKIFLQQFWANRSP